MAEMLPAGLELDNLIAEKVMGLNGTAVILQRYSTDISAAWKVVEKIGDLYLEYGLITCGMKPCDRHPSGHMKWECCFSGGQAIAPTAPHAICLAALQVVEAKTKAREVKG